MAGGKSKRIGVNKALQKLGNETLTQIIINKIEKFCVRVEISANANINLHRTYPSHSDLYKNIGPLGGIYTCLKKSSTNINLIVSCDTPFISEDFIAYLIENISDNFDVIVPKINNFVHPTIGIYSKGVLPVLEKSISEKEYNLFKVISRAKIKTIEILVINL